MQELDQAREIFLSQQSDILRLGQPRLERNLPLAAGQLKFAQELTRKIAGSVKAFKEIQHPVCYSKVHKENSGVYSPHFYAAKYVIY